MQRLVLASHGYLAEGMKNSAQIIVGKSAKIYTICAYVKEGITLESQINELFDSFPEDDEMIVVTDIFGGSVNNEFMQQSMIDPTYLNHLLLPPTFSPDRIQTVLLSACPTFRDS